MTPSTKIMTAATQAELVPNNSALDAGPRKEDSHVRVPWTNNDYTPAVSLSRANKLVSSAIAPLVAAARGYESVDELQAKDFARRKGLGDGRSKTGAQFLRSFRDDGQILTMPWFRADQLARTAEGVELTSPTSLQVRPQNPRQDSVSGKPVKYEFLVGQPTVLDFHPALNRDWVESAPRVMIAEGLLKGDAALSALLRCYLEDDELILTRSESRTTALGRLSDALETIPVEQRVAVVSIAGVGNWRNNPEWNAINVRGKDVLIAVDGDVATNWQVWKMTQELMNFVESKGGSPLLVRLADYPGIEIELAQDPHLGLDDFFHHIGDWSDISEVLSDAMPERPIRLHESKAGEWRVSADGLSVQECCPTFDITGAPTGTSWQHRVGIGGRVKSTDELRTPTDEELETGKLGAGTRGTNPGASCTIELRWHDELHDEERTADVTGPLAILAYPPQEWDRRGANMPAQLMLHPEWPPKNGRDWFAAIKANEREAQEQSTTWASMGWVPVAGEPSAAFIAGNVVVAPSDSAASGTHPGVTEQELSGASRFGITDTYSGPEFLDPTNKNKLADDIEAVFDAIVLNGPWPSKETGPAVLALALRPVAPVPTHAVAFFTGAPSAGKSWTAKRIMSFWARRAGSWENLPGSASDTYASTEKSLSVTPIWVVDDLAPTTDKSQAELGMHSVATLVRAVYNNLGKRRMTKEMTSQPVPTPMAVLILTSENDHPIQSIRERMVQLAFASMDTVAVERLHKLTTETETTSRITGAAIRNVQQRAEKTSWPSEVSRWKDLFASASSPGREIMLEMGIAPANVQRPLGIVADLSLGLHAFRLLAEAVGLEHIAEQFHWAEGGLFRELTELVARPHVGKSDLQPGAVLINCLRLVLSAGHGHVTSLSLDGMPPLWDGTSPSELGWSRSGMGDYVPRGPKIGLATTVKSQDTGEEVRVILFNIEDAFNVAQAKYPNLIQYGASSASSWRNARETGLIHPHWNDKVTRGIKAQINRDGTKHSGFPISLETLFSTAEAEEA